MYAALAGALDSRGSPRHAVSANAPETLDLQRARWTHGLLCLGLFYNTESRLECTRGPGIGGCLSKRRAYEERVLSRRAMARGFVTCTAENQAKTDRRSRDDLQRHGTSRPRKGAQEVCPALCRSGPAKPRRFAVQSVRLTTSRCGTKPFVLAFSKSRGFRRARKRRSSRRHDRQVRGIQISWHLWRSRHGGGSRNTSTLDTLATPSAITPPPWQPPEPPGLTESELTTSGRRHSSSAEHAPCRSVSCRFLGNR